jgi:hypothetical protein
VLAGGPATTAIIMNENGQIAYLCLMNENGQIAYLCLTDPTRVSGDMGVKKQRDAFTTNLLVDN